MITIKKTETFTLLFNTQKYSGARSKKCLLVKNKKTQHHYLVFGIVSFGKLNLGEFFEFTGLTINDFFDSYKILGGSWWEFKKDKLLNLKGGSVDYRTISNESLSEMFRFKEVLEKDLRFEPRRVIEDTSLFDLFQKCLKDLPHKKALEGYSEKIDEALV